MRLFFLALLLSLQLSACATSGQAESYRGEYTFGHEVNVFCPAINSQCYWLGPNSSQAARDRLKQIYRNKNPGLYKPVCVVVDGVIDRDSQRDGFAADYDGLIHINEVHGDCDGSAVVAPGDLNHRRWVLVEHNGVAVNAKQNPVVLDFGEKLFVEITEGCFRRSGFAELDSNRLGLDRVKPDRSGCAQGDQPEKFFSDISAWQVELNDSAILILYKGSTRLAFVRDDWR